MVYDSRDRWAVIADETIRGVGMHPAWRDALRERIEKVAGRNAPLTRDDVHTRGRFIRTAPLDAYEVFKFNGSDILINLQPKFDLWEPLLDELGVDDSAIPRLFDANRIYACVHCGRDFFMRGDIDGGRRLYCSPACHYEATANTKALAALRQRNKLSKKRAAARADRHCGHCGKPFEAKRSTARFCSDKCRIYAYRAGHAETT
jgi:hypothetical protein